MKLTEHMSLTMPVYAVREAAGLTQSELARRMRTTQSSVSEQEHGNPSWKWVRRAAEAAGLSMLVFFFKADCRVRSHFSSTQIFTFPNPNH